MDETGHKPEIDLAESGPSGRGRYFSGVHSTEKAWVEPPADQPAPGRHIKAIEDRPAAEAEEPPYIPTARQRLSELLTDLKKED